MATLSARQAWRGLDIGLFAVTMALLLVGLAALVSFSLNSGQMLIWRQATFALIGLVIAWILTRVDYRFFGGIHWTLYALSLGILTLVVLFGQTVNGTTGWFNFGLFQIQPVEFVKIAMAVVLAKFFVDNQDRLLELRTFLLSGLVIGAPVLLVLLQPDFGSAFVLIVMWVGMVALLPIPRRFLFWMIIAGILASIISWFTVLQTYQKNRIRTFFVPTADIQGAGYNVRQSITAIGSGGWFGRGLGLGPQSQLNFLPERQTDFIFATIGEELGFIGAGSVIAMFSLLFLRLYRLLARVRDTYSILLLTALGLMFFTHAGINIGMNMGVFPVTGIPLPFLSYGGSSLLASLIAIGLIQSVSAQLQSHRQNT